MEHFIQTKEKIEGMNRLLENYWNSIEELNLQNSNLLRLYSKFLTSVSLQKARGEKLMDKYINEFSLKNKKIDLLIYLNKIIPNQVQRKRFHS